MGSYTPRNVIKWILAAAFYGSIIGFGIHKAISSKKKPETVWTVESFQEAMGDDLTVLKKMEDTNKLKNRFYVESSKVEDLAYYEVMNRYPDRTFTPIGSIVALLDSKSVLFLIDFKNEDHILEEAQVSIIFDLKQKRYHINNVRLSEI